MRLPIPTNVLPDLSLRRLLQLPGKRSGVIRDRLATLASALELQPSTPDDPQATLAALEARLADPHPDEVWLSIAVLTAALPEAPDVVRAVRACRTEGSGPVLSRLVSDGWLRRQVTGDPLPAVEVITGEVLVDLEHTSRTELATGIQRVARMTASRWARDHEVVLIGWHPGQRALRRLRVHEASRALTGSTRGADTVADAEPETVVVPWRATYLLPELAPERDRTLRLLAFARFSRCRTGVIGFDCVPISSAETTDVNVSEAFAGNLAAVRHFSRVVGISEAAAEEYRGWRHMLSAIGERGPEIEAISLPVEAHTPSARSLAEMRDRLVVGSLPVVLSVGTHEPRKNHLAVLHAAEVLWRRGVRFSLTFIGGHSWNSERFDEGVARLREAGRPIETLRSVTDDALWAAYQLSHCVVFPSLNEGFGLPVAEALASGTPVVTSAFGSMAEIAADGGAVLVDPRDDDSLVAGLDEVLTDPERYSALRAAAAARPQRTWDEYAAETWAYLVEEEVNRS